MDEVTEYTKQVDQQLKDLGITDPYYGWYLTTTYGKQTDYILGKINYFLNEAIEEKLIRAEVWYGVHHEMVNGLSDFFVRRTGRLYFDIHSIHQYRELVQEDLVKYLGWDEQRLEQERSYLDMLLQDAATYYEKEME